MTADSRSATANPARASEGGLAIDSPEVRILLAITFLFPILLCTIVLPSPASDLREHINLGLTYRLSAFAAPPLQTWLAGAVALTGARDAWLYIVVAQVLNFVGLIYLILTARRFIGEQAVVPLALMFCGSIFYSLATPSMALNADQIQVPLWAGITFHGLMALRDDRWRDWILFGALIGLSILAKYTVLLLLAVLVVALALMPAYRKVFLNPKLYVAGLCALPIIAVHAVPEWYAGHSLEYAGGQLRSWASAWDRVDFLWNLVRSYLLYGAPVLIALGVLAWRGHLTFAGLPKAPPQRLILLAVLLYLGVIVALIFSFGLNYATRHTYPLFGLSLLALLTVIRVEPAGIKLFAGVLLAVWTSVIIGSLVYSQVGRHSVLQEPGPAAAKALRQEWDQRFSCGPAYIIGSDRSARLIAINYGKPVLGLAFEDTPRGDWFDKTRMADLGAIVVTEPEHVVRPDLSVWFKGKSVETLALPYRRTRKTEPRTYAYYLVAPKSCSSTANDRQGK
jgi:hypothetical protein